MREPGPDHPISITRNSAPVRVSIHDRGVVEAAHSLDLQEASYPIVRYLPRDAADMGQLERSDHTTYCPYKGMANYFHVKTENGLIENAFWTYEDPYPSVAAIKDYLAVYSDQLTLG